MTPDYAKIAAVLRERSLIAQQIPGCCDACGNPPNEYDILCRACLLACADACEAAAKLPRTADGVIFSGAMVVYVLPAALAERCWLFYKRDNPDRAYRGTFTIPKAANVIHCPAPIDGGNYVTLATCPENDGEPSTLYVRTEFVYSTRELAQAAAIAAKAVQP